MIGQATLEITDILDSIRSKAKNGYITQEVLGRLCFGEIDMIKSLVDGGFLIDVGSEGYSLTRKLLNYDPNRQSTLPKYEDLWLQKWGNTSSLV